MRALGVLLFYGVPFSFPEAGWRPWTASTLAASATSGTYDLVGPTSCRTDVPSLELQVAAGDYQVLVEATGGGISPFTGTWTLDRGDAYASCFFIVTTLG